MNNHYEITEIRQHNQRRLLTTKILGGLSMIFVYAIIATMIGAIITFISPLIGMIVFFGIIIISFALKWRFNNITYHGAIDNFLQLYHAQRLLPSHRYQNLFNIIDELCVGMNVRRPDVYLIDFAKSITFDPTKVIYEHPEEKDIYDVKPFADKLIQYNILGLELDGRTILVMNQAILNELSRYELEALMAIELGYTKNLFNTFLLMHHIMYDTLSKFVNVMIALTVGYMIVIFDSHRHTAIPNYEWNLLIWAAGIFLIMYVSKLISYWGFRNHNLKMIRRLDDNAIALTNNPNILVSALQKINHNNYTPIGDSMYNNLWLNPLTDESADQNNNRGLNSIYDAITNTTSLAKNVLMNQSLRIPIAEQLNMLYYQYGIGNAPKTPHLQDDSPQGLAAAQHAYEKEFNGNNVNFHYDNLN